ncbi:MAG: autotransporter outer membrane beta-barrel domain-containing protein [Azonexus sp.]
MQALKFKFQRKNVFLRSLVAITLATTSCFASAQLVDVGSQTSSYTGNTRGFWFVAPANFTIGGIGVPTDASSANFDVAILRFSTNPPAYPTNTTSFETLYLSRNNAGASLNSVNIAISAGQIIGVLGSRAGVNSYGAGPYNTNILGSSVVLSRLLMQENIGATDPDSIGVSTESGGSIGRLLLLLGLSGPSAADTLASMQSNASDLRKVFSLQASYVNPGLSYDCSIFDKNGVCVAFSGRYSTTTSSGPEATSGVLAAAYRVSPNIRIGGFAEQFATDITSNGVRLSNTNPDFGVFGVWSQTETGDGLKIRAAYRYGNHDVKITRDAVGSAEAATGNADLTTQGGQLTVSNGYRLNDTVLASPYLGLRYTNLGRSGYTESASAATPLTYSALNLESTTLLLGVNLAAQVSSTVTVTGSVGIESDMSQKISNYSASGVADLGSIQFNNDTRKTRAVASAGVAYKIDKAQQISAQLFYREEAFGSTSTATGMLTYAAGF